MALRRHKESSLDLCARATTLGNTISIRLLEYISTVKNRPHGLVELASEFLKICQTTWSIETGLKEAKRVNATIPATMVHDLDTKLQQIADDFLALNQMLEKLLEYENKGRRNILQRGWRTMFVDTDVGRFRECLGKRSEALRSSAQEFKWPTGIQKPFDSLGIGYTGLAAALNAIDPKIIPAAPTTSSSSMHERLDSMLHPTKTSTPSGSSTTQVDTHTASSITTLETDLEKEGLLQSCNSKQVTKPTMATSVQSTFVGANQDFSVGGRKSLETLNSISEIPRTMQEIQLQDPLLKIVRDRATSNSTLKVTPKQTAGSTSASLRAALVGAIQQQNYKMVERLLDVGVPASASGDYNPLREAIACRDVNNVRLLLLYGADPNEKTGPDASTPLHAATQKGFVEGAEILLKGGADPNIHTGPDGDLPLSLAVFEGNSELVKLYLTHGGEVNNLDSDGNTILLKAITKKCSVKLVDLLIQHGSDPNGKNSEGQTALFGAIQAKRLDLVTFLLSRGADPNLPGPKHPLWPATYQPRILQVLLDNKADCRKCPGILELATSINNLESVMLLLDAGMDPNTKKDGIYTPLCSAIRDDRGDLVTLLLANGADPNVCASEYPAFKCVTHHRTHILPQIIDAGADLHHPDGIVEKAIAHNNKDALLYLLERGASPNGKSTDGYTPLTTAIRDSRNEFVDILLANGADPSIRGQNWPICMAVKQPCILKKLLPAVHNPRAVKGVMEMAVVANEMDSIKLLLEAGVSVEDKNGGVFSPLTTAIREHRKEIVRFLLDAGADVNAPGEHLPIIKAIRRYQGDPQIIETLLDRGADVNLMYRGWNAVLQAVENGDADLLRLIVEKGNGVDLLLTDDSGRTVMDIVTERGWDEAVSILIGDGGRKERDARSSLQEVV
ncbi:uncharacterized protein A1O9_12975 [Exophiala aquamarina CBS 119918]|uniref:Uncharacterized protein n=1 Tax=Exophiala aquamarina CBS 119918 TaxID=1182545 RepID=A0A072NSX7_9EURO|nr:uncharacterized protein A1O9_12975 [Exophiala aquamarina CBS 119918]KEF50969.1 hypothetical protein A1O9_12975 [Exophiala aquamarina CBS 119918]